MNEPKTLLTGKKWVPSEKTDIRKTMRQASPKYDQWLSELERELAKAEYDFEIKENR